MSKTGLRWRVAEAALWAGGAVLVAVVGLAAVQATSSSVAARSIDSNRRASAADVAADKPQVPAGYYTRGELIGRLEIPRIGLTVPVLESFDPETLVRGVGHIPGTAVPGGLGNMVLAGHRDTFFRPLRKVQAGMEIDVVTGRDTTSRYIVDSTRIVTPDQVEVTETGDRPGMTLITCFPFDYIGAAPRRFIVRAHLVSVTPE